MSRYFSKDDVAFTLIPDRNDDLTFDKSSPAPSTRKPREDVLVLSRFLCRNGGTSSNTRSTLTLVAGDC